MFRSSTARVTVTTVAVLVTLGLLHDKPWQHAVRRPGGGARQQLSVGFLPVT